LAVTTSVPVGAGDGLADGDGVAEGLAVGDGV